MSKEIFPASFVSTESADGAPLRIGRGDESIRRATREEAERAQHSSQHAEAVEKLKAAYVQALQRADLETLFATPDALSGVFLPCPAETYYASKRRVLVVGQETRGWRNKSCSLRATSQVNDAEVAASMQATWEFASHGARRSKYGGFNFDCVHGLDARTLSCGHVSGVHAVAVSSQALSVWRVAARITCLEHH